ncbi:MAG: YfhO family protein [Saprospiraceae bacterium]|nr:YfhO family protein [Saprospiraceae bacterium]
MTLASYSPNRVEYESNTEGEQLAVFSEIWYGPNKGWQAYVDGKAVDHIRADYVLRAMKVPSGKHKITFEFKPKAYYLGETISLISSLILIGLLIFYIYTQVRPSKDSVVKA